MTSSKSDGKATSRFQVTTPMIVKQQFLECNGEISVYIPGYYNVIELSKISQKSF